MSDISVLVTGHRGFIGSHLYKRLQELGIGVEGIDLKDGNDICTVQFERPYTVIFHLAARASIPASFEHPVEIHQNNVYGSLRLLEFAKKVGSKVIFSSSSSVYGEPKIFPTPENAEMQYMSPYAFQKFEVEQYMKLLKVPGVVLRYFNVFGEGQEESNKGDNSLLLATFLQQKRAGKPLTIVGTGEQRRDFVYVEDVVDANIAATKLTKGCFNIGSGRNYSVNQIADFIDYEGKREYLSARPEPMEGLANIEQACYVLKWRPTMDVKTWLKTQL